MKIYAAVLTALALLTLDMPAFSADTIVTGPGVSTEEWEGKVLTATFKAGMCFEKNGKARGVLILRHANGNKDVYHLYGHMKDNEFALTHSSGHFVDGALTSPGSMKASVKIKNGPKLTLNGKRILNVPLAASDCAPLR